MFLNSNQAQTVIAGSGKSGKLLLMKDSYGNTFAQFPVEDYAEVHVIDLRFFKGDVAEYAKENGITDTLVLYGTQNFVSDTTLSAAASIGRDVGFACGAVSSPLTCPNILQPCDD